MLGIREMCEIIKSLDTDEDSSDAEYKYSSLEKSDL